MPKWWGKNSLRIIDLARSTNTNREHMEMGYGNGIFRVSALISIFSYLFINPVFAEEVIIEEIFAAEISAEKIQIAKSDDTFAVPDSYKKGYKGKVKDDAYTDKILEDGRLFVQVNLASYHPGADSDDDFNEFNPGLGLEYHFENFFIAGGFFENSIDKVSTYWGAGTEHTIGADWFGLGVIGGVVTGYDDGFSPRLAAVPYLFLKNRRTSLKIHYLPAVGEVEEDALGFALRIDLGGLL